MDRKRSANLSAAWALTTGAAGWKVRCRSPSESPAPSTVTTDTYRGEQVRGIQRVKFNGDAGEGDK